MPCVVLNVFFIKNFQCKKTACYYFIHVGIIFFKFKFIFQNPKNFFILLTFLTETDLCGNGWKISRFDWGKKLYAIILFFFFLNLPYLPRKILKYSFIYCLPFTPPPKWLFAVNYLKKRDIVPFLLLYFS